MGLIGIGMFFDGFDLYLIATVLGAMLRSGFSTLGQNAQFIAATFLGMMLGSFATGFLGDRYRPPASPIKPISPFSVLPL